MDLKTAIMQYRRASKTRFQGRASRAEFWYFSLWTILTLILGTVSNFFFFDVEPRYVERLATMLLVLVRTLGQVAFPLCVFWNLAVWARRLHDLDLPARTLWILVISYGATLASAFLFVLNVDGYLNWPPSLYLGWIFFLSFAVAAVATPVFLILAALPETPGPNRFGPEPLRKEEEKNENES